MTTTARPLGCPEWCELDAGQHEPAWHADALRVVDSTSSRLSHPREAHP